MNKIQVKILYHNFDKTPLFLAKLTQRGHEIKTMQDLEKLYRETLIDSKPMSQDFMSLPHTTLRRMNYMTVAIVGLSTKAVSQLRTHATRLTFVSTSTQYSAFYNSEDNYVMPEQSTNLKMFYEDAQKNYETLFNIGFDKDTASYILPQGLRKALIISGNLADWEYLLSTRLCNRNTKEVQYICELIIQDLFNLTGIQYLSNMMPPCVYGRCNEGKFCCGKPYHKTWRNYEGFKFEV